MPKAKHHDAIKRQWEILRLLPARPPGISVANIIKMLESVGISVTKRTVERDLNALSLFFGLQCNDKKKPYQWHWMKDTGIALPALTLTDALSLKIVEGVVKPLIPRILHETLEARFKEANTKLKEISHKRHDSHWVDKVRHVSPTLSLLPPTINERVLDVIQNALLKNRQLEVRYRSMGSDCAKPRLLNPLALVQRGAVTYLVATAKGSGDVRIYAAHRIEQATLKKEPVVIPQGFSIDEYIRGGALHFGSGKSIRLQAYIDDWLYRILSETPLSDDQKIKTDDDVYYLTATVEDTWQLFWWLLSLGDGIEVIKPKQLKDRVVAELSRALAQYEVTD